MIHLRKIVKFMLLSMIFIFASAIVFLGVQWFSNSVGGILLHRSNLLQSSLEGAVDSTQANVVAPSAVNQNELPLRNWQVEDLPLDVKSAISVEVGDGAPKVLFKKNEEKKLPIASLTKLMTAVVVLDNYDLSKKVIIDDDAMAQEGEQGNLALGQTFTVKGLLYITLIESSNRAAYALSEVMSQNNFITAMNSNAKKLGLANTHFTDVDGLDPGSYSTAQDLANLAQYVFDNYALAREIIGLKEFDLYLPDGTFHHHLVSTDELLGKDNVIGGKTGYTLEAEGCFMVVQESPRHNTAPGLAEKGNHIISVILGSGDRFGDMQKIIDWEKLAYQW